MVKMWMWKCENDCLFIHTFLLTWWKLHCYSCNLEFWCNEHSLGRTHHKIYRINDQWIHVNKLRTTKAFFDCTFGTKLLRNFGSKRIPLRGLLAKTAGAWRPDPLWLFMTSKSVALEAIWKWGAQIPP